MSRIQYSAIDMCRDGFDGRIVTMISDLSIIIPTLNEEKYLRRLLESIVEQDWQ